VQAKLASQAVERHCRVRDLSALLTGRLFDERGRRMTPTHSNKKGVRYSYYVSQAALRNQSAEAFARVAAPELEALVVDAVRCHLQTNSTASNPIVETDRELIERHLLRATLSMTAITLHLRQDIADAGASGPPDVPAAASLGAAPTTVTIPWTVPAAAPVKGIVHVPAHNTPMKQPRDPADCPRQGPQMGQGHRAWPDVRRYRGSGRKSRTPCPPSRAARFRVAAHHHRHYRRHRSGRDHGDDAGGRASPFLGRAGTADKPPRTGPSAPECSVPSPAGRRDVLIVRRSERAGRRAKTWRPMLDSATRSKPC